VGFRFRKSIKVMPGVRLNVSKSGVSTSIGGKGATVNLSKRGTRSTVGIPGSGISYSTLHSTKSGGTSHPASGTDTAKGCGCLMIAGVLLMFLVTQCHGPSSKNSDITSTDTPATADYETDAPAGAALSYGDGDTVYIDTASLRMRDRPSGLGSVVGSLKQGEEVKIVKRSGEWLQVAQGATLSWIAAQHVALAGPGAPAAANTLMSPGVRSSNKQSGRPHHSSSGRSSSGIYGGSTCPCSGSHVCVGPRGGRYCITSGGNKRYGV
jgi:hypothetical protein